MFNQFPKRRKPLPEKYQRIYSQFYIQNRSGGSIATKTALSIESWMHRNVASDVKDKPFCGATLEIGAGTLNHLIYEEHSNIYDIVEPFSNLYEKSPYLGRVRNIFKDISFVTDGLLYERIISIAAFEHIENLPEVVARSGLLLSSKGSLRVGVPSEGTFFWEIGWKLTTGLEFKIKYGLDNSVLMKYEHINTALEISQILSFFFRSVVIKSFGICPKYSIYQFYDCRNPDVGRCKKYLSRLIVLKN